jgi:hypothetical protein
MMMRNQGKRLRAFPRAALLGGLVLAPLAACDTDTLLEVEEPEFATPVTLDTPEGLQTLVNGALAEFAIGFSGAGGNTEPFVSVSSVITDEMYTSDSFTTRLSTDARNQQAVVLGNTSDAAFNRLQSARRQLDAAAAAVGRVATASDARRTELRSLEAYTYILLADGFCGAVPISSAPGGVPGEAGAPLTTAQLYEAALARFDSALAVTPSYNLARVGRGRALLGLGRFADAATAVVGVPRDFAYIVNHSANSTRQQNAIFALQSNGRYSVSDREGTNGLPYRSANDPRVLWDTLGTPFSTGVPFFRNRLHHSFATGVPLASGVEARLIVAEAALRNGATQTALDTLNTLRANVGALMAARWQGYPASSRVTRTTLEPLTTVSTDVLFSERGFWLYTTGHRQGDLRRLIRQYNRSQNQVFPVGVNIRGNTFGADVAFPIPFDEINNANFKPAECNVGQA